MAGRPEIQDEVTPFKYWLIECGLSGSTAKVYAAEIRRIRADLGRFLAEQGAVDRYFEMLQELKPLHASTAKSAWLAFVRWVSTTMKYDLPVPSTGPRRVGLRGIGRQASSELLPKSVARAVHEWVKYTPKVKGIESHGLDLLLRTNWGMVHPDLQSMLRTPGLTSLRRLGAANDFFDMPTAVIETFGAWAEPRWPELRPSPETPLVPIEPGSMQPAPLMELQAALRTAVE